MNDNQIIEAIHYYQGYGFFKDLRNISDSDVVSELNKRAEHLCGISLKQHLKNAEACQDTHLLELDSTRCFLDDSECDADASDGGQYQRFLEQLSRISRGAFLPDEVREDWDSEEPSVTVTFGGVDFKYDVFFDEDSPDFIDVEISDWINTLIVTSGIHFSPVYTGDQTFFFVALTDNERQTFMDERGWKFEKYSAWPIPRDPATTTVSEKKTSVLGKLGSVLKRGLTKRRNAD